MSGGGMSKKLLWNGSTTGTINVDTTEYSLIGIVTAHNGVAQETILNKVGAWQVIGSNYQNSSESQAMIVKSVYIGGTSIRQGVGYWALNGHGANDPITAVYGYK